MGGGGSDGWGEQNDGWSDDWGGDVALDLAEVQGGVQQAAAAPVELVAEREADIEDGWGDDTWGGFEESARGQLAPHLRLSVDKVGDKPDPVSFLRFIASEGNPIGS